MLMVTKLNIPLTYFIFNIMHFLALFHEVGCHMFYAFLDIQIFVSMELPFSFSKLSNKMLLHNKVYLENDMLN